MLCWSPTQSTVCTFVDVPTALVQEPEDIPWVFNPVHRFRLTPQRLAVVREHLFGGAAAAALSDRLSDFELVQLLVCCTGELLQSCCTATLPRLRANIHAMFDLWRPCGPEREPERGPVGPPSEVQRSCSSTAQVSCCSGASASSRHLSYIWSTSVGLSNRLFGVRSCRSVAQVNIVSHRLPSCHMV